MLMSTQGPQTAHMCCLDTDFRQICVTTAHMCRFDAGTMRNAQGEVA